MKKSIFRSLTALILCFFVSVSMLVIPRPKITYAATEYITIEAFAKLLAKELGLSSISGTEKSGYVNALLDKGIMKEGDVKDYTKSLLRGDAMVFLNRADEYLYGDTLEPELIQLAIDKRISDIKSVKESKREDVAKAYLKGFVKGYRNGLYSTDRTMKVNSKIAKSGVVSCIKMIKNKSLRAKISPDGQMIRTTNLPKNAKIYPYILDSYSNSYYEKELIYERVTAHDENGYVVELKNGVDYFKPLDIDKFSASWYQGDFSMDKKENIDLWVDNAKSYVDHVFNVDYRTINNEWSEEILQLSIYHDNMNGKFFRDYLSTYLENIKKTETVVECNNVSADGSTLYNFRGEFYIRVFVKYRIVSTNVPSMFDTKTYLKENPYKGVLFSTNYVDLRGYKKGNWTEGIFDVHLSYNDFIGIAGMDIKAYKLGGK